MHLFTKTYNTPGTQPGHITSNEFSDFSIDLLDYNAEGLEVRCNIDVAACDTFIESSTTTWIHVQGTPSSGAMKALAADLKIHELYAEDIINVGQRPKVEINDEQIFIILALPNIINDLVSVEQVSLFLTRNTVISFATGPINPFETVIKRLKSGVGKLRKLPADYLMYTLVDTIVDFGFPLLENYSDRIQQLEDELLETKDESILTKIHDLRRELLLIRRQIWPHREVIGKILRSDDSAMISDMTSVYFRDCHDHTIAVMDMMETYHEMTSSLMELYLTSVSLKLNDVIKFLTIFTTVFIPPTFIVGVYGMNFDPAVSSLNMPELGWKYGYIAAWSVIALTISGMLIFFRKQKWI